MVAEDGDKDSWTQKMKKKLVPHLHRSASSSAALLKQHALRIT